MVTSPDLNDPEALRVYLATVLRATRDALDHGASFATTLIAKHKVEDDYFWAHAARWQARKYLADLEKDDWELGRKLPNTGIELIRGPIVIRILRRYQDGPPNPGSSRARGGFYTQYTPEPVLGLEWPDGVRLPDSCNLIVDWALDPRKLISLALSKPRGIWKFMGQPKLEWRRPLAFSPDDEPRFETADDDLDVPRFDDSELGNNEEAL